MKITYIKMLKDKKEAKEKNVLMKHLREKEQKEGNRPKKTFTNSQKTNDFIRKLFENGKEKNIAIIEYNMFIQYVHEKAVISIFMPEDIFLSSSLFITSTTSEIESLFIKFIKSISFGNFFIPENRKSKASPNDHIFSPLYNKYSIIRFDNNCFDCWNILF